MRHDCAEDLCLDISVIVSCGRFGTLLPVLMCRSIVESLRDFYCQGGAGLDLREDLL